MSTHWQLHILKKNMTVVPKMWLSNDRYKEIKLGLDILHFNIKLYYE